MPLLIFRDAHGNQFDVDAEVGQSVMQAAVQNGIDGIVAECGGECRCATCHAYVDEQRARELPAPGESERAMLEAVNEPRDNSRLTCQITVSESMAGMYLELPERQL